MLVDLPPQVKEGEESVGHESGRKIVSFLRSFHPPAALFNADVDGCDSAD